MKFFESNTKVNPVKHTIFAIVLCLTSSISFIIISLLVEFDMMAGGFWFAFERLMLYGLLPFLAIIPFIRIGKTIKIIFPIIGLSVSSMLFIFDVVPTFLIISSMVTILITTLAGNYANKWSKEWNSQFTKPNNNKDFP